MPVKTSIRTRDFVSKVQLPAKTATYTPISHMQIIDSIYESLDKEGFKVKEEHFNTTINGYIINGHLILDRNEDKDLQFEIAFLNSYNKQRKATVVAGSEVEICSNGHILGDTSYGFLKRKHTGAADIDVLKFIPEMVKNANSAFQRLVKQKERMKEIEITRKTVASIIGDLYLNEQIITDTQIAIIRREVDKPSFNYDGNENSLWTNYNHITLALKESHPAKWIDNHGSLNRYLTEQFQLETV